MNTRTLLTAIGTIALSSVCGLAGANDCDRACLKGFTDAYFDAMAAHDASKLPVAPQVKFTENGTRLKLGEGFWKSAGETAYRMEIFDPQNGAAAVQAVVRESQDLVMFLLRLKVAQQKITEVETIVARKGVSSGRIWAPETLTAPSPSFTMSIRPAERNSRLELMAAADAYWRAFNTNGTPDYHPAPFMPDTKRFENGLQTANVKRGDAIVTAGEQFDRGLFKAMRIYDIRFPVVDEERGVVLSIARFGRREALVSPTNPNGEIPLVAEFFAVQDGKIREIQVVMTTRPGDSPTGW